MDLKQPHIENIALRDLVERILKLRFHLKLEVMEPIELDYKAYNSPKDWEKRRTYMSFHYLISKNKVKYTGWDSLYGSNSNKIEGFDPYFMGESIIIKHMLPAYNELIIAYTEKLVKEEMTRNFIDETNSRVTQRLKNKLR